MSNAKLTFELAQLPQTELAGVSVSTSMEKSHTDCPSLWFKTFMPLAKPLLEKASSGATYGISLVHPDDFNAFDYWAALPWAGAEAPEGMKKTIIPAGTYMKCEVKRLADLSEAYTAMARHVGNDPRLEFVMGFPSVEEYPAAYPDPEAFYLYMPVKKVQPETGNGTDDKALANAFDLFYKKPARE